jgi:hypothetical protein
MTALTLVTQDRSSRTMEQSSIGQGFKNLWAQEMVKALPSWVDRSKCAVFTTTIGCKLNWKCPTCGETQLPVRWKKGEEHLPVAQQAVILRERVVDKHNACHVEAAPLSKPEELQQELTSTRAKLKRKADSHAGMQGRFAAEAVATRAKLQPDLDELQRYRQSATKAATKRAVPIDPLDKSPFPGQQKAQTSMC